MSYTAYAKKVRNKCCEQRASMWWFHKQNNHASVHDHPMAPMHDHSLICLPLALEASILRMLIEDVYWLTGGKFVATLDAMHRVNVRERCSKSVVVWECSAVVDAVAIEKMDNRIQKVRPVVLEGVDRARECDESWCLMIGYRQCCATHVKRGRTSCRMGVPMIERCQDIGRRNVWNACLPNSDVSLCLQTIMVSCHGNLDHDGSFADGSRIFL